MTERFRARETSVDGADADPWQHGAPAAAPKTAAIRLDPPGMPGEEDLRKLADFLTDGDKIAILAGAGARWARVRNCSPSRRR